MPHAMSETLYSFLSIDLPALLTAVFASLSCGLLGALLVLRRQSLMGDAISHAVLPGIVIGFLITGSRTGAGVFLGAAAAGILAVVTIELVRHLGRVESGAAMGVVFSLFFALGVLLIEQAAARSVDLDAECLLHGQLERVFWLPPAEWSSFLTLETFFHLPQEVFTSFLVCAVSILFLVLFSKELKIASFDPEFASSSGFSAQFIHILLMALVASAVVASFNAVGAILVIALLICPGAAARLFTDRFSVHIVISGVIAVAASIAGYVLGGIVPLSLGFSSSISSSGMITVVLGAFIVGSLFLAPSYGIIAQRKRRHQLATQVAREDLLGLLYRLEEAPGEDLSAEKVRRLLIENSGASVAKAAFKKAIADSQIQLQNQSISLTPAGRTLGTTLIRTHRLWEHFLVDKLGLRPDHVHSTAMELEHFTSEQLALELDKTQSFPDTDPQDHPIPRSLK